MAIVVDDIEGYSPHPDAPVMWKHQRDAFLTSRDKKLWALFCEQRTGKSRIVLDTVAYQYEKGAINALLVVALPSGVPMNWKTDEIPNFLPPRIPRKIVVWQASKVGLKSFNEEIQSLLDYKGLSCLLVNGEAIVTDNFRAYARKFLAKRMVFAVGDETTLICKTPSAKRTKIMHAIARQPNVKFRRILDGTPVAEGPLDLYAQMKFLDVDILGQPNYTAFKAYYANWERKTNHSTGYDYDQLISYNHLEELNERLSRVSTRVLRKDCFDVPEKLYMTRSFDLSKEQRRVYDSMRETYEAELHTGEHVTATMVIVRMIRLQQIASNIFPSTTTAVICPNCEGHGCPNCDDMGSVLEETPSRIIDPTCNPRLNVLREELVKGNPCIVWARFTSDIDEILKLAKELGISSVRYDGKTSSDEKAHNKTKFQEGRADLMAANQNSAGRGLPLWHARDLYYYSNTHSLSTRLQSEDRAEASHKTIGTGIIDLIANDTGDELILKAFREKRKISDIVMKENNGRWLS